MLLQGEYYLVYLYIQKDLVKHEYLNLNIFQKHIQLLYQAHQLKGYDRINGVK